MDWATLHIPDMASLSLFVVGLLHLIVGLDPLTPSAMWDTVWPSVVASLLAGTLLLAVAYGHFKVRGQHGLGLGDVKLVAAATVWIGFDGFGPMLLIASLICFLHIALLRQAGHFVDREMRVPFGPHLALGVFATWLFQALSGVLPL